MSETIIEPSQVTVCDLCGKKFTGPKVTLIETTGGAVPRILQLLGELYEHIEKDHPAVAHDDLNRAQQYLGLARLFHFRSTDPDLQKQRDSLRWAIHQAVKPGTISDAKITAKSQEVAERILAYAAQQMLVSSDRDAIKAGVAAHIAEIVTWLRDTLEEPGKYPDARTSVQFVPGRTQAPPPGPQKRH